MSVSIVKILKFEECMTGNRVIDLPIYLEQLFNNEYSPIRTYLHNECPDCKLVISIDLEIVRDK